VRSPDVPQLYPHPARLILILSLAPTVGLGIGRFAYALVLPDMRDTLAWSYSAAGFMNTINAAGYLAGALLASRMIRTFGLAASVRWGTLACVLSLALCAMSGDFYVLSFARLLAGVGAAAGFVGGGTLAATIAQSRPEPRRSRSRGQNGPTSCSACSMPDPVSAFWRRDWRRRSSCSGSVRARGGSSGGR
jgi:predicted MFS family arabinose efflux permease